VAAAVAAAAAAAASAEAHAADGATEGGVRIGAVRSDGELRLAGIACVESKRVVGMAWVECMCMRLVGMVAARLRRPSGHVSRCCMPKPPAVFGRACARVRASPRAARAMFCVHKSIGKPDQHAHTVSELALVAASSAQRQPGKERRVPCLHSSSAHMRSKGDHARASGRASCVTSYVRANRACGSGWKLRGAKAEPVLSESGGTCITPSAAPSERRTHGCSGESECPV
jgi:hypothetical protein